MKSFSFLKLHIRHIKRIMKFLKEQGSILKSLHIFSSVHFAHNKHVKSFSIITGRRSNSLTQKKHCISPVVFSVRFKPLFLIKGIFSICKKAGHKKERHHKNKKRQPEKFSG